MTDWTPPAPGPWQQDSAHSPNAWTPAMAELYPAGFNRGFTETFNRYGMLLDRLAMAQVNGFTYHQPQPFDMPGPDGPMSPEDIGAEFGRRAALAEESFAVKRWRTDLELWDDELKPASIARYRELGDTEIDALTDAELNEHLEAVGAHLAAMVYQHHRMNVATLLPVGDLALHVAGWTGQPPTVAFGLLDGYSPVSGVAPREMDDALAAIRGDDAARALLKSGSDPQTRLDQLRAALPPVDDYVRTIQDRVVEGFDIVNTTLREQPAVVLAKLSAALDGDPNAARRRADEYAVELREQVPAEHRPEFDELLEEARALYRLRDERGLYSDIVAVGLLRRAMREIGRRAHERGIIDDPLHILDATTKEAALILDGGGPTGAELATRGELRRSLDAEGAPRHLGPPPPHPPSDELPPALGRLMSSIGFMIEGILGQLDESGGDDSTIIGIGVTAGTAEGPARIVHTVDDLLDLEEGEVVVAAATSEAFNSVLHLVAGIVTDHGSHASHAAIVAREMGFPAVVGTVDATSRIMTGDRIRLDAAKGEVTVLR
ncbi:MAG: PEP-utilizing enzyme [Acidimicrobiia bacterium]|nr:PEP-utilizing enzyme [Acidimicrobiia bacterium]